MVNSLESDLKEIIKFTDAAVWEQLKNKNIFLTGGTGFFGTWLLEGLLFANDVLALRIKIWVLSRDPERFKLRMPHLASHGSVSFLKGDVSNFNYPDEKIDFIIHAATDASKKLNDEEPLEMMKTIVEGTRHVLEFSKSSRAIRMLMVSSGAIYGKQSSDVSHISEDTLRGPDVLSPSNTYAESKRLAELMCSLYAKKYGIEIPIARGFAFVGPYLNLNIHFAIGNFIRNGLQGETIEIQGNGTPLRSYLYSSDLVIWLLTILTKGQSGRAYNVGSDEAVSIEQLAMMVSECFHDKTGWEVRGKANPSKEIEQYVPSIERVKRELGLQVNVKLKAAIQRTITWNKRILQ